MRLQYPNRKPYGGVFYYKHPVTKEVLTGVTWRLLLKEVAAYNKANGYPVGLDFENEVEQNVCVQQPSECIDETQAKPRIKRVTMSEVLRGTRFMGALVVNSILGRESPFVSQEEAERRAAVCSTCKFNETFKKPCSGLCAELKQIIELTTKGKRTPFDSDTAACSVCGCWTRVQVHFRLDLLDKGLNDVQRAQFDAIPHCWKKTK